MKMAKYGVTYNIDKTKRSNVELKQNSKVIGPGHYELLDSPGGGPSYKLGPSAAFVSSKRNSKSVDPQTRKKYNRSALLRR